MAYTPNLGINSLDALIQLKMLEQMPDTEMVQAPVERPTSTPMPQSDGSPQGIAGLLTRYAESKLSGDQPIQMADGGSIMDSLSDRVMGKTTNSIMDSLSDRVLGNVDNNEYENNYDYSYEYTPYASRLSDVAEPEPMLSYSPQDAALSDLYSENFDFGGDDAVAGTGGTSTGATSTGATSTGGISGTQTASNQSVAQAVSSSMMGQVAPGLSNAMTAVGRANAIGSQFGMSVPGLSTALGIANASPLGVISGLVSMVNPPLGLMMGLFGRGVNAISNVSIQSSPSNQSQQSGVGNTTMDMFGNVVGSKEHTANLMGYNPSFPAQSKVAFSFPTISDVTAADVEAQQAISDFGIAHGQEVGNAGQGGGMSSAESATDAAESGNADGTGGGHMAQGGMIDFYGQGGIASLAYGGTPGYANQAFEGMVPGVGSGMSDDVPFSIEGQQPALLSRDEYVLPADVVSQLGDGSSGAGADMLDDFIDQVRNDKYGNTNQPPPNGQGLIGALQSTV